MISYGETYVMKYVLDEIVVSQFVVFMQLKEMMCVGKLLSTYFSMSLYFIIMCCEKDFVQ